LPAQSAQAAPPRRTRPTRSPRYGFNNSTAREPKWVPRWDALNLAEGWLLSAADRIERDDDQDTFKNDRQALAFVEAHAKLGSTRHATALWYHRRSA
jgi:hypothetical protein